MGKRLTDQERSWRELSERQFQTQVIELARLSGWLISHFHDSRRQVTRPNGQKFFIGDKDSKGFPDCCMVRAPEILFWELKKELGKTTPEQDEWLAALSGCGLEARVIRPSDFDDYIVPRLTGRKLL